MFSYAGIICAVPLRRKRSIDRPVMRLEFMVAVWREHEDSQATLLALLYCLYGQIQIMVVYQLNYWSLFRRFGMCYGVFYISYKMILRLHSRMDCALTLNPLTWKIW